MTRPSASWRLSAVALFIVVATMNAGGYRYGISDQAFYIPAIVERIDPSLFPRDKVLLEPEGRLTGFDDLAAAIVSRGVSLPWLFFLLYLVGLAILGHGLIGLATLVNHSKWTTAAFLATECLRHRITKTGVNTLEGYLHPRMLVYGIGVASLAAFLRGRTWAPLIVMVLAAVIHPTTALWFLMLIGIAAVVSDRDRRHWLIAIALVAAVVGTLVLARRSTDSFTIMDADWRNVLAAKDYLFPNQWPRSAWVLNLAYLPIVILLWHRRRMAGLASPREAGVVVGCAIGVGIFLVTLPLVAAGVAFTVQLQMSRLFWLLDLIATLYVVWFVAEGRRNVTQAPTILAIAFALAATARGLYVHTIAHPERAIFSVRLPDDDWHRVQGWVAARTDRTAHVLTDPGHAWRYGSSFRVAGLRDTYVEEMKDTALALYSRESAMRVGERLRELGDFEQLTTERVRQLANKYDLDYLIVPTERRFDLNELAQIGRFKIYRLGPTLSTFNLQPNGCSDIHHQQVDED